MLAVVPYSVSNTARYRIPLKTFPTSSFRFGTKGGGGGVGVGTGVGAGVGVGGATGSGGRGQPQSTIAISTTAHRPEAAMLFFARIRVCLNRLRWDATYPFTKPITASIRLANPRNPSTPAGQIARPFLKNAGTNLPAIPNEPTATSA